jgi:hypothetical protein
MDAWMCEILKGMPELAYRHIIDMNDPNVKFDKSFLESLLRYGMKSEKQRICYDDISAKYKYLLPERYNKVLKGRA